jgi:hypothetical protein
MILQVIDLALVALGFFDGEASSVGGTRRWNEATSNSRKRHKHT